MTLDEDVIRQAIDQSYNAVLITTAQLEAPGPEIVYVNPAMCVQSGYRADELIGQTPRILQGPATDRTVLDRLRQAIARGQFFEAKAVNYRKDGSPYLVRWNISALRGTDGQIRYYVSVQRDITALTRSTQLNALVLANLDEGVFGVDRFGRLSFMNQAAADLLGYPSPDAMIGRHAHQLLQADQADGSPPPERDSVLQQVLETGVSLKGVRQIFARADGRALPVKAFVSALPGLTGEIDEVIVSFRDISERQALEAQLEHQATQDPLTGALNRPVFETLLAREHARAERQGEPLSLMLLAIDHFKTINERHSHATGDQVLKALVHHLSARLRSNDLLTRWDGKAFALLLPDTPLEEALAVADVLRASVADAALDAGLPPVTISIGVTLMVAGADPERIFQQAIQALDNAKREGRNRVCAI